MITAVTSVKLSFIYIQFKFYCNYSIRIILKLENIKVFFKHLIVNHLILFKTGNKRLFILAE